MGCFPGDTRSLKPHPWDGLWNKGCGTKLQLWSNVWGSEQQAGAGPWDSTMGRDGTPVPKQRLELVLPALCSSGGWPWADRSQQRLGTVFGHGEPHRPVCCGLGLQRLVHPQLDRTWWKEG